MTAPLRKRPPRRYPASPGPVVDLAPARIARALGRRKRYRYVRPRVEAEGEGWKIVSPNCSRNVDAAGGEIDIAWLLPDDAGRWQLHARDHRRQAWVLTGAGLTLEEVLAQLCSDPARCFWP